MKALGFTVSFFAGLSLATAAGPKVELSRRKFLLSSAGAAMIRHLPASAITASHPGPRNANLLVKDFLPLLDRIGQRTVSHFLMAQVEKLAQGESFRLHRDYLENWQSLVGFGLWSMRDALNHPNGSFALGLPEFRDELREKGYPRKAWSSRIFILIDDLQDAIKDVMPERAFDQITMRDLVKAVAKHLHGSIEQPADTEPLSADDLARWIEQLMDRDNLTELLTKAVEEEAQRQAALLKLMEPPSYPELPKQLPTYAMNLYSNMEGNTPQSTPARMPSIKLLQDSLRQWTQNKQLPGVTVGVNWDATTELGHEMHWDREWFAPPTRSLSIPDSNAATTSNSKALDKLCEHYLAHIASSEEPDAFSEQKEPQKLDDRSDEGAREVTASLQSEKSAGAK